MKKFFQIIILILTATALVLAILFWWIFYANNTKVPYNKTQSVFIPTETNFDSLQSIINPYLKSNLTFKWAAKAKMYHAYPRAGHYVLERGMGNQQLINTLRSKNQEVKVVFNNQETLAAFAGRVAQQIEADSIELLNAFLDKDFLNRQQLNSDQVLSLFIPNTYSMYWNTDADSFAERMVKESARFWNIEREILRKKLKMSREEVVTLASIVHQESKKPDERPRVAGVYLNRLKRGMKLQADPTVVYAMKKKANDFDLEIRRVLYKDLKTKSPYNTYRNKGLPPGPICMPDIDAIDAVLNSERHNYLYFVADPYNPGYHLFGKTLSQHAANKRIYTRWLNRNGIMR